MVSLHEDASLLTAAYCVVYIPRPSLGSIHPYVGFIAIDLRQVPFLYRWSSSQRQLDPIYVTIFLTRGRCSHTLAILTNDFVCFYRPLLMQVNIRYLVREKHLILCVCVCVEMQF
jgi:hypothetical protein